MGKSRAELKAKLMGQYEAIVEEILSSVDESSSQTLADIETLALRARAEVGVQVTAALVDNKSGQSLPGPRCEKCGQEMRYKGRKHRYLRTRSGEIAIERAYYYCEACRQGIFPPR
jgi:hypothetical protein